MAYVSVEPQVSVQGIGTVSPVPTYPGGKIIRASDPVYGNGEFIYLQGAASTIVGTLVTWGATSGGVPTFQTTILPSVGNQGCPVAVATAAILATQWGWYQIAGVAIASAVTFAAPGLAYIGAAGQVISTSTPSKQILNAAGISAVGTPAAGQVLLQINRPHAQGAIT